MTTEANKRVAELHDRMPVILRDKAEFEQWLVADDVAPMLRPLPEDALVFSSVNPVIYNARNDVPVCIQAA